jgi:hypothetical protein
MLGGSSEHAMNYAKQSSGPICQYALEQKKNGFYDVVYCETLLGLMQVEQLILSTNGSLKVPTS